MMPFRKHNFFFEKLFTQNILIILITFTSFRLIFFFLFDFKSAYYSGDSIYYIDVAKNIYNYGIHVDNNNNYFFRPPLYPLFISLLFFISKSYIFIYFIQSLFFFIFIIFFYFVLKKIEFKYYYYLCLIISINPTDILYNGRILAETLVTILILSSSILFFYFNNYKTFVLSAIFLGLATLTKDFYLYLFFLFLFFGIIKKNKIKHLFIYFVVFIFVLSPWYIRNYDLEKGKLFLSKGILWSNLWVGTWLDNPKNLILPDFDNENYNLIFFEKYDFEISKIEVIEKFYDRENNQDFFKDITIDYIMSNPIDSIKTWIKRYPYLWLGSRTDLIEWNIIYKSNYWYFLKVIFYLFNLVIIFSGFLGILLSILKNDNFKYFIIPIMYHSILLIPLYNIETRYSQPIFILMIFYSLYFYDYVFKNIYKLKK